MSDADHTKLPPKDLNEALEGGSLRFHGFVVDTAEGFRTGFSGKGGEADVKETMDFVAKMQRVSERAAENGH